MPAFRLDRSLTLHFFQRLGRGGAKDRLPILMYHSISEDPEEEVSPYYRVCTSPQRFRAQMQWLKDNGCCGVT
ncbi:MAG: hypothetical protein WCS42_04255, partial [Verrucomicrobiota bacterium]